MPTPFTSTFASAAAGSNGDRRDNGSDWSRSRPNGATQTFRRASANTTAQPRDPAQQNPPPQSNSGAYIHPHHNSNPVRNGVGVNTRYTREEALEIYNRMYGVNSLDRGLPGVFQGSWDPTTDTNGAPAQTPRGDSKDQYPGPEFCWEAKPVSSPFGLRDYNDEEKELFSTSVNSPIKMAQPKEAGGVAPIGTRKTSLSSYTTGGSASRPGTRRRDTSDSFTMNGPMSPAGEKTFFRGDSNTATPPPALLRRRTDFKDDEPSPMQKDAPEKGEEESQAPFGSLRRSATGPLSAGLNPPANSPWAPGPGGSAFGSMGSFGSFNVAPSSATQEKPEQRPGFGSARGSSRFKDMMAKTSTEDMHAAKDKAPFGALEKLPEEDGDATSIRMRDLFKTRPNRSETNPYDEAPIRTGSATLSQDGVGSQQNMEQMGASSLGGQAFNEPMSPTGTNPYQSPYGVQRDDGPHEIDTNVPPLPPFGAARRNLFSEGDGTPRSAGGFGAFPGFGAPPGPPSWSAAPFGSGTPARERVMGFGDSIFTPLTDMQSPGAGLGSGFFGGGFGSVGRSSRLGGMLPQGMQDPMRGDSRNEGRPFDRPDSASHIRDPFDNGFGRASGAFDEGGGRDAMESAFGQPGASGAAQQPGLPVLSGSGESAASDPQQTPTARDGNGAMPAAQQRTMVMPDRMRWIYQDPQGNVQGPWSGLEMHDWFKAGFFTAELLVKKMEDAEFEPLAQLVRRIGNSREPFLVPQIGVPHGPPSNGQTSWPNAPQPPAGNNAQPPFASAFPSFGTTLTAEQQNALERRKQEEQYLMARQKEHLAQQQMAARQMGVAGPSMHSLQHHASAHSLHSQPSYGSITSPGAGYHPSPIPTGPPQQSMQHAPIGQPPFARDDNLPNFMDRMNLNQASAGPLGAPGEGPSQQQMSQMLQDRSRLQQQDVDARAHQEAFLGQQGRNERLEEFNELRGQVEDGRPGPDPILAPIGAQRAMEDPAPATIEPKPVPIGQPAQKPVATEPSLTEQVQWTAAQQQQQEHIQGPPVSISPLPAPAARRNRQHVAESLVAESRSQSQTPVETPAASIAPWAERVNEHKGPSLKEIQEAEARKAAEQAALAEAARLAQAEQERLTATHAPPPAPGLPASATWGTSSSPGTPTASAGSVWAKPTVKAGTTPTAPAKKTLAQIQKEEEARKQRATAAAAVQAQSQTSSSPVSGFQGKRYAELASKAAPAPATGPGNAWTTVGSSGKTKPPATVLATPQVGSRSVSSTATPLARPTLPASRNSNLTEKTKAKEEFMKWAKSKIGTGLDGGINADGFIQNLLSFPDEVEIIADSIYASSQTLDGRGLAQEFVRRKKLMDKGIVEPAPQADLNGTEGKSTGGGWSEVAKKGPEKEKKEEPATQFKVVAGKKKAKR